jgi:superfamily II DNA or RNA helicase
LRSRDARDPRLAPREWQLRELDKIVGAIARTGAATLSAAPGAGKTVFTGLVFEALRDAGIVERLMVVVPRRGLAEQWAEALSASCHIELKPHSALERPKQDGVVVTYQSLPNRDQLEAHLLKTRQVPTLLALDEVHHLARDAEGVHRSWGNAIAELAGDVETGNIKVAAILNLSGTLWRSHRSEQISTVRYTTPDDEGKIQSLVDGEATVQELIRAGQLRSVDLYRLDAQVRVADYQELQYVEGNLSDVDEKAARATVAHLANIDSWRSAFVASVLDKLEWAHRATDHHVKALIVAARQDQAEAFRDEVDRQMRQRGLQPLAALAISRDEDEAQRTLESFRAQKRVGVLCTVDMAGEGYDCPDIAVLGYASNKLTSLYVRQVTARAMRVTDRERELGATLPAIVVLPDSNALVAEFLSYMAPYTHEVRSEEEDGRARPPDEDGPGGRGPRLQRFVLTDAQAGPETITVSFLDGSHENVETDYAAELEPHLIAANIPEVYRPRAVAAAQRTIGDLLRRRPFDFGAAGPVHGKEQTTHEATVEQQAAMLQEQLHKQGRWWAVNGNTPVSHFNREVNQAAGIGDGRRGSASVDQLEKALRFAKQKIADYVKGS